MQLEYTSQFASMVSDGGTNCRGRMERNWLEFVIATRIENTPNTHFRIENERIELNFCKGKMHPIPKM